MGSIVHSGIGFSSLIYIISFHIKRENDIFTGYFTKITLHDELATIGQRKSRACSFSCHWCVVRFYKNDGTFIYGEMTDFIGLVQLQNGMDLILNIPVELID